jgi:hypothetical protein
MYGCFFFLKRLLGNVQKWRFFLDQDPGLRAACLAAFRHGADSGEVAHLFQDDLAHPFRFHLARHSGMISPGAQSLAGG